VSGDWWDDLPPVLSLATVADGTAADGMSWVVRAGGTRAECNTVLDIQLPGGQRAGGGGMGGPALPPGRLMNVSVHRCDSGLHYLVGRVGLDVARLRLLLGGAPPATMDLSPAGTSPELGVAFVAAILPAAADLVNVTALDEHGRVLEATDTSR